MKRNVCAIDRSARILLGLAIGVITLLHAFGPYLSWVLCAIGLIMIVTGAIGVCPLYSFVKFATRRCANKRGENCRRDCCVADANK